MDVVVYGKQLAKLQMLYFPIYRDQNNGVICIYTSWTYTPGYTPFKETTTRKTISKEEIELIQKIWTTRDQILLDILKEDTVSGTTSEIPYPYQIF